MNKKNKVSVIVPVYNVEQYIDKCLNSLEKQNFDGYEVIIIDDGSTDDSSIICKEYEKRNDNFRYFYKENGGLSSARNMGLAKATGEYIFFCDSDDWINSDSLKILFEVAHDEQLDVIIFSGKMYDGDNQCIGTYLRDESQGSYVSGVTLLNTLFSKGQYDAAACLHFVRNQFLIDNKIDFYEKIIREDELFTFQVYFYALRAKSISNMLYYQNVRNGSIMTSSSMSEHFAGMFIATTEMGKLISKLSKQKQKELHEFLKQKILDTKNYYYCMKYYEQKSERDKLKHINELQKVCKIRYSIIYTLYFGKQKLKMFLSDSKNIERKV